MDAARSFISTEITLASAPSPQLQVIRPMVFRKLAPLTLLCLAACSQPEEEPDAPAQPATVAPTSAAAPVEPVAQPAAPTIPSAYRGAWDWTGRTCDLTSDLRMEISPQEIIFYESAGTVKAVREEAGQLLIDLAMQGEGMEWEQTTVLRLVESGTLLETQHEDPTGEGLMRLKRCPGENTAQ
jgi:hypothetical protein